MVVFSMPYPSSRSEVVPHLTGRELLASCLRNRVSAQKVPVLSVMPLAVTILVSKGEDDIPGSSMSWYTLACLIRWTSFRRISIHWASKLLYRTGDSMALVGYPDLAGRLVEPGRVMLESTTNGGLERLSTWAGRAPCSSTQKLNQTDE